MKEADHEIALDALNQNEYAIRIPLCESHLSIPEAACTYEE